MDEKNCRRCKHFNIEMNSNHVVAMECPYKSDDNNLKFRKSQMEDFFEIIVDECEFYKDTGNFNKDYYRDVKNQTIPRQQTELDLMKEQNQLLKQQVEELKKLLQDRDS
ncbi:MAG: hypothetical protein V7L14_29915 [Nostoc sp.]|uniref:hypothetical protein n=1 Tax=Nostoc sp. TaxID=1180 RepID=UPI002FF877FE